MVSWQALTEADRKQRWPGSGDGKTDGCVPRTEHPAEVSLAQLFSGLHCAPREIHTQPPHVASALSSGSMPPRRLGSRCGRERASAMPGSGSSHRGCNEPQACGKPRKVFANALVRGRHLKRRKPLAFHHLRTWSGVFATFSHTTRNGPTGRCAGRGSWPVQSPQLARTGSTG